MLCLEDRVVRIGQKSPTGIIKEINDFGEAVVLWGVSDGMPYTEIIRLEKLQHAVI